MTQEKRRLWSQIIFPSMVLLAVAAALVAPAFLQKKTFTAVKLDEPGAASANWANVSEQEFFEQLSVAVRAEVVSGPEHYDISEPWEDYSLPADVYEFWVGDVLINSRTQEQIESGRTYKVHSLPSALTALDVAGQENSFILFLYDRRDMENFELEGGVSEAYYDEYFDAFGYGIMTPIHSIFRTEDDNSVKTVLLPKYLQGEGEYTTMDELREILYAGREKYGINQTAGQ